MLKTLFLSLNLFNTFSPIEKLVDEYDNLSCMVEAVYFEVGNQPPIEKIGVAHVIKNRSNHNKSYLNGSYCDIVNRPKHFSYKDDERYKSFDYENMNILEIKAFTDSLYYATLSNYGFYKDVTDGATHYINRTISTDNSWYKKIDFKVKLVSHHYYYEK